MAMKHSILTLREAPDRTFEDPQQIPFTERVYFRCECGKEVYYGEKYWNFNGNKACSECIEDVLKDYERMAE